MATTAVGRLEKLEKFERGLITIFKGWSTFNDQFRLDRQPGGTKTVLIRLQTILGKFTCAHATNQTNPSMLQGQQVSDRFLRRFTVIGRHDIHVIIAIEGDR